MLLTLRSLVEVQDGGAVQELLDAGAIASAEAFGSPALDLTINPAGITSAEAFGAPAIDLTISPASIPTSETFGTPAIVLTLNPGAIASGEVFGVASLALTLNVESIDSAEAFGLPLIQLAGPPQEITDVGGIPSAAEFGTPEVSIVWVGRGGTRIGTGRPFRRHPWT